MSIADIKIKVDTLKEYSKITQEDVNEFHRIEKEIDNAIKVIKKEINELKTNLDNQKAITTHGWSISSIGWEHRLNINTRRWEFLNLSDSFVDKVRSKFDKEVSLDGHILQLAYLEKGLKYQVIEMRSMLEKLLPVYEHHYLKYKDELDRKILGDKIIAIHSKIDGIQREILKKVTKTPSKELQYKIVKEKVAELKKTEEFGDESLEVIFGEIATELDKSPEAIKGSYYHQPPKK